MFTTEWTSLDTDSRRSRAKGILVSHGIARNKEDEFLERYCKDGDGGEIDEVAIADVFLSLSLLRHGQTADKALLALYYVWTESDDGNWSDSLIRLLRVLSDDAPGHPDTHVRARLHWIRLAMLRTIDEDDEGIREYVESIHSAGDFDVYVWDRVFGALEGWGGMWRLYPQILVWKTDFPVTPERYWEAERCANTLFRESLDVVQGIRSRMEACFRAVVVGKLEPSDFRVMVRSMAFRSAAFPFDRNAFERIYESGTEQIRGMLWEMVQIYRSEGSGNLVEYEVEYLKSKACLENHLYFDLVSWQWDVNDDWSRMDLDLLWQRSLDIAEKISGMETSSSALWNDVAGFFEKTWINLIGFGVLSSVADPAFGRFLEHRSPFVQRAAASALLEMARHGWDIRPAVEAMRHLLKENPSIKGPFSTGEDISDEDREKPVGITYPEIFFGQEKKPEEGGFFNLGALTGLLEGCQPPHVAYRLSLALRIYAESNPGRDNSHAIVEELKLLRAEEEMAAGDSEPENEKPEDRQAAVDLRMVIPTQVGPLTLPEIVDFFREVEGKHLDNDQIEADLFDRAADLEQQLGGSNSIAQRDLIKRVFGDSRETSSEEGPFVTLYREWTRLYGKNEDRTPIRLKFDREGSVDYLARYLPREGFGTCHGIYFNVPAIVGLMRKGVLDHLWCIRSIAVHELVHFLVEETMDKKSYLTHGHTGEPVRWCRVEEAAANWLAKQWLERSQVDALTRSTAESLLFKPEFDGKRGLPGYGEWGHVDSAIAGILATMLENRHCDPSEYAARSAVILGSWNHVADQVRAKSLWSSIIAGMDGQQVPYFLDLEN